VSDVKAVCQKHGSAYSIDVGCLDCIAEKKQNDEIALMYEESCNADAEDAADVGCGSDDLLPAEAYDESDPVGDDDDTLEIPILNPLGFDDPK
jgi:hypothetical protein